MGGGRALCRITDLLELTLLVSRLALIERKADPIPCKENSAATVKRITPQSPWGLR